MNLLHQNPGFLASTTPTSFDVKKVLSFTALSRAYMTF
ncbi:hypothetical protein EGR_10609 [Echinococcus granulosus]|uniref:Uncharacterized protein n=1 Tax=Echinococcus granulosus TaxID=6210 RepID=W6U1Y7_ECHGR|nr:hypothetical protein EGR_10609 [Echinococcus granulosus]EUB54541.1 hypothetical protein EGR_10609 [Echinococcus granulosus]